MTKNYYDILEITRNASPEEIKAAYRRLAMKYHPDRNPRNEKWAEEKFKEITEAYGVLGDPEKKLNYDAFGKTGNATDIVNNHYTRSDLNDVINEFEQNGLSFGFLDRIFGDIIREFFAPSDTWWSKGASGVPIVRDIGCLVEITPRQAKQGLTITWGIRRRWYELKIPAGVKTGQGFRYKGLGREVGGIAGDLYFHIKVLN